MNTTIKISLDRKFNLITLILSWTGIVVMSSLYVTVPLISYFTNFFKITSFEATLTSSVFCFFFAISSLFAGPLSEKFGRKKIIFIGLIFLSFFSILIGFCTNIYILIILRAFQGLSAATFSPVALSYVLEAFPNHKKITALGFISTSFLVAGILGQAFSRLIAYSMGWNYIFFILAIVYILTALLIHLFIPSLKATNPDESILENIKNIKKALAIKNLRFTYVNSFVLLFSFVAMYTILNSYLASPKFDLNNSDILYITLLGIIGKLLSPLANNLINKFKTLPVLRFALLLSAISLICLSLSNNIIVITIISIFFVTGIALAAPSLVSLIGTLGDNNRGSAVSLHTFILFLGTSAAPILTIFLINSNNFLFSFSFISIFLFIGILSTFFIKNISI